MLLSMQRPPCLRDYVLTQPDHDAVAKADLVQLSLLRDKLGSEMEALSSGRACADLCTGVVYPMPVEDNKDTGTEQLVFENKLATVMLYLRQQLCSKGSAPQSLGVIFHTQSVCFRCCLQVTMSCVHVAHVAT